MAKSNSLVPVIVGVGQIADAGDGPNFGPDALDLMAASLKLADSDAGGGWLDRLDFLGVENQISSAIAAWPGTDTIMPFLVKATGLSPRSTLLTKEPSGDGPIFLLNHAANLIAAGDCTAAAIVGGEGLRTAARRAAAQASAGAARSNAMNDLLDQSIRPFLRKYGLITPTDVYPLYETATRAAWGQSFEEARRESGILWSGYARAAAENSGAWIREQLSPDEITQVSDRNRMVTFPYTKFMVANSSVNQGAAIILTSLDKAREAGIPENNIVYVGGGAAAHENDDFFVRDSYIRSPAMTVSIRKALEISRLGTADLDFVELYSCFPCVPKMARRVLDWPLDRLPSVYGGLTFGGGPIGNCMMHAAVVMTLKLRAGGRNGLIYANGGFATHNHTIVLTCDRPEDGMFPQDFNYQSEADHLRGPIPPLDEDYTGLGRIEAYAVPYGRDGLPLFGTIVGRSVTGVRFVCRVAKDDKDGLQFLVSGNVEPVGTQGHAVQAPDGYTYWRQ